MAGKKTNPYYQGEVSDHFDGVRFFVPERVSQKKTRDIIKWQMSGKKQKWPRSVENRAWPRPSRRRNGGDFSVTFIGHATVLIQVGGLNIITDPFFSKRASPLQFSGPRRVREPGIALADLPPIDFVLLSHNHYDHLDLIALGKLHDHFEPVIVTPLGNGAIVNRSKRTHQIVEADWGDRVSLNQEVKVTLAPARHWSRRGLRDTNMALWCAFVLETPFGVIYFAGDTGYGEGGHFRQVREQFGDSRLALLPIGAYEPRWFMKTQHMNPDDAVKAHMDLGARQSIAIHHGTVQLTDEGIDQPVSDLKKALEARALDPTRFLVLDCGEEKRFHRID